MLIELIVVLTIAKISIFFNNTLLDLDYLEKKSTICHDRIDTYSAPTGLALIPGCSVTEY